MSLPFDTTTLPELTEKETKVLMAAIMQNGLMIQQLQLMVALKQKEEEQRKECRRQKEQKKKEEEEKQKELKVEEVRRMGTWSKEESWRYVKRFRGYRGDRRCRECGWFGHMAYQCKREEIEAEREQRRGLQENR